VVVERSGASISIDDTRNIGARAQRRPMEASRQVLVVTDIHLAVQSAPALLKTLEEPPASTVFVLVGDELPPSLVTIASRCVKVAFDPVPIDAVTKWLVGHGVSDEVAHSVAVVSDGRLDRAELLATDPGFAERIERWRSVPTRLDGTGAAAAMVAAELLNSTDELLGPLRERHAAELVSLSARAEAVGAKGIPGRKDVEDQHKREERRWKTDELRTGLATLARVYRDRLLTATDARTLASSPGAEADSRELVDDVEAIVRAAGVLGRNPNEALLMEALMIRLSGLAN
jgi:DNA polymerase-3 subunit delta'